MVQSNNDCFGIRTLLSLCARSHSGQFIRNRKFISRQKDESQSDHYLTGWEEWIYQGVAALEKEFQVDQKTGISMNKNYRSEEYKK